MTPEDGPQQRARRLQGYRNCNQALVHASQCNNAECSLSSCQKMKKLVQHTQDCRRRVSERCPVCRQLIALCCFHARHCQGDTCQVPYCRNIKHKLRQPQFRQRQFRHRRQQA